MKVFGHPTTSANVAEGEKVDYSEIEFGTIWSVDLEMERYGIVVETPIEWPQMTLKDVAGLLLRSDGEMGAPSGNYRLVVWLEKAP